MKHKIAWLFLFSLLTVSCQGNPSETSTSTSTTSTEMVFPSEQEPSITKKLEFQEGSVFNEDYYQYDLVDLSTFAIEEVTYDQNNNILAREPVTDYQIVNVETGETLHDKDRLTTLGEFHYEVQREGAESLPLMIVVFGVSSFRQTIALTSLPKKTAFIVGDTFNADGLLLTVTTKYTADKPKTFTETTDDYTLTINEESAEDYVFTTPGVFQVTASYEKWSDQSALTVSYTISVLATDTISTPGSYDDDTINFVTDNTKAKINFTNSEVTLEEGDKGYYSSDEVTNAYNISTYSTRNASNSHYTPSTGEVPLLIVPIITPGDEALANQETWDMINKAFWGSSSDLHFESLHSYYYQSSYGKLDLRGGVTGYFNPADYDKRFKTTAGYTDANVALLPQLALDWAVDQYGIDPTDYDSDSDGYIDGMWLIYLHPSNGSQWWAYTSSTGAYNTDIQNPVANCFGWASTSFLDDTFNGDNYPYENAACDAHVLIHETGHMLGAQDYYAYTTGYITDYNYDPLGKADMMDNNVGDHNVYTKLLFGWITPTIVYGDCTISLGSSQLEDNVIVLYEDGKEFVKDEEGKVLFNAFDEYLCLEYYQCKNLNVQNYDCYDVNSIKGNGIKLYHADNRLFQYTETQYSYNLDLYEDPFTPFAEGNDDIFYRAISNSYEGTRAEENYDGLNSSYNAYDELRLIGRTGKLSKTIAASENALFKAGHSFSLSSYQSQFVNGALDNGADFSTSFSVLSIQ